MPSTEIDVKEYSYFAGNQWREAADKKFFDVREPYTGKLFARVAAGSRPRSNSPRRGYIRGSDLQIAQQYGNQLTWLPWSGFDEIPGDAG